MSAMSNADRAKQFLPFAALKGFETAVKKRQKLDFKPVILGEDAAEELDGRLRGLKPGDNVRIRFYGNREFNEIRGSFRSINETYRRLELAEAKIGIDDIVSIEKENE